jgi:hypothetical protein
MQDGRSKRAAHPALEVVIDDMANDQSVERHERFLVIAAKHHEDVLEAGVTHLSHGTPDEGFVPEWKEQLLCPHARRGARRENDRAHHSLGRSKGFTASVSTR